MNIAFVCESPFQVMNSINLTLRQPELRGAHADIFIGDIFSTGKMIVDKLRKESIFETAACYQYLKVKDGRDPWRKNSLTFTFFPRAYMRRICPDKPAGKKYDRIFISALTPFATVLIWENPQAEVCFFDDGLASYFGRSGDGCLSRVWLLLRRRRGPASRYEPHALYVYNPAMCHSGYNTQVRQLVPIDPADTAFFELLKRVFSYQTEELYDTHRFVYLSQPSGKDPDTAEQLNRLFMDNDVVLRRHPRDPVFSYAEELTDKVESLWELVCMNQITDSHVLISEHSTALVTPRLLLGREPYLIFFYPMFENNYPEQTRQSLHRFTSSLEDAYTNKDKILYVSSLEELEQAIRSLQAAAP